MNKLKQEILNLCNNSDLPLEAIIFILKDIWRDAEDTLREYEKIKIKQDEKEINNND